MKFSVYEKIYERPARGSNGDEPERKGARRFFWLLFHHCGSLVKLNLLVVLCMLPALAFCMLAPTVLQGASGMLFWPLLLLAAAASVAVGPAMTAANYLITKMLQDEPGFFWHDFKKAFREGFRQSAVFGMLYMGVAGMYLYLLFSADLFSGDVLPIAGVLLSAVLFCMVYPYFFLQASCMALPPGVLLKNSLLLALSNMPRSLMSALCLMAAFALFALYVPFLLPLAVLFGYAVPALISLMWIWPGVNEAFGIEKQRKERKSLEYAG